MSEIPSVWEAIGAAVGVATILTLSILFIFYGWKIYRVAVAILTGCVAAVVGWFFIAPHLPEQYQVLAPLVMGLIGIAVAIPLQRVVSFATTGALGAAVAAAIGVRFFHVPLDFTSAQLIAVASAGFLIAGIPAAIFLRFVVVFSTAGYGALLAIGAAALLLYVCVTQMPVLGEDALAASIIAWITLTIIGMAYQYKTMKAPDPKAG